MTASDALAAALDGHRAGLDLDRLRADRLRRRVRRLVEAAWRRQFWAGGRADALAEAVRQLDAGERAPHRLAGPAARRRASIGRPPARPAGPIQVSPRGSG